VSTRRPPERRSTTRLRRERVLVTHGAGGLGRLLCRRLHRAYDVISIDRRPFDDRPKDVEHFEVDLRRKGAMQLLKKKRPDAIVHIGAIHVEDGARLGRSLETTAQVLKLVELVGAKKLVFLSSATLYGPSPTSASFLTEEAPLLAAGAVPALGDPISADMMVQSFFWKRPETETVILRPVHIVGPHLQNAASRYLRARRIPVLFGFDPMMQIVHEDDLVDAVACALKPGARGVVNITGQTQAPLSRLIAARGASSMPVPGPLLRAALSRAASLRLTSIHPGSLDHLRYSYLVDGARALGTLGYAPGRSLQSTLTDLE
jgi:UDP-glucose 4-epimerase